MKRLFILLAFAFLSTGALQAQWHEIQTGIHDDLYGVYCINADTAFVCGDNGVILKTEDGGETWVEKNRTNGIWFNDIHFAGNIGYASGNQLFKTTDAGETWQVIWPSQNITNNQKSNSDVNKSDFFLIGTDTLYWYKDCIMKSSHDAGLTWNEANGVFADMETCKTFFEDNVGYIVVSSQMSIAVSKSTDYGQTWGLVFEKNFYNRYPWGFAVQFIDKDNVRIIPSTPHDLSNKADEVDDFVMFVTNDGFETFSMQTVENNGYYGVITDSEFSDANNGCYIAYQKWYDNSQCSKCAKSIDLQSFACVTKDGGQTWQFAYDGIDGAKKLYGIDGSDTTFYVTSQNGYVYRTGIPDTIYEWYDYLGDVYEPVIKPDVDSISWVAWSRNTEGQIVKHILYAKSYADSICFYDDTCFIGNLREDNGRLWIRYANDSENEYLIMDMTRNSGVFSFPSGNLTMVADVFYREDGRKVIVFDPLYSYSAEWKEQLMFIEGVGPNFLPITDLSNNSQYYLSCKFEDGENVYTTQNDLFDECNYSADRWIFPLVFTDATNNPDTVWFVQHDYETTLEQVLNDAGINPNVGDEDTFRVYFMQDGVKTRVVSSHLDEAFINENIYADNYEFPITMNWRKSLLEQYYEFFGPMAYTEIRSAYTINYTLSGLNAIICGGESGLWYGVLNEFETSGLQPAAYYSENGSYYGNESMLQEYYSTFFPMSVSLSRSCLYHLGNIGGFVSSVEGHTVNISWNYNGCVNPEYFFVTRVSADESNDKTFTTTETSIVDYGVPTGKYTYRFDAYYSDGFHLSEMPLYSCFVEVTVEPDFDSQGFEWYYELQNPDGSITYQHLYYLADTVIDDRDIDIIVRNNTLYDKGSVTTHEYIYEESGKVYWWNATTGDFTTLYDFTAMPGDEWEIKVGTESITMHVDAVGETEYNNRVFKTLQVSDAGNLFSGTIVSSVGHLTSFFPEKLMRKQGESTVEGLRCLWNGTELVFKYGDKDCDEVYEQLHLSLSEATTNSFSLYPNPTDGQLSITAASGGEYRITNLMGQTLLQGRLNSGSTSIDVSGLGKGMYFMTIEGRSKKFIVQ